MLQQRPGDRPPIIFITVHSVHPVGELGSMDLARIKELGEDLFLNGMRIAGLDTLVQTLQQEAAEYRSLIDIERPSSIEAKVERDFLRSTRRVFGILIELVHPLPGGDAQLSQD
jgi:hypothetical protein